MDATEFKALRPEFSASSYDARIATLLAAMPELDENRAGNQLNMALSAWVAGKLARQDFTIKFGVGAAMGSSTSTEKMVDKLMTKTSQSTSQSAKGVRLNTYEQEYADYLREFGSGAVAVGVPCAP